MNPTTLQHDASDARTATAAGRGLAEMIDRERAKGAAADSTWLRARRGQPGPMARQGPRRQRRAEYGRSPTLPAEPRHVGPGVYRLATHGRNRSRLRHDRGPATCDGYLEEPRSAPSSSRG